MVKQCKAVLVLMLLAFHLTSQGPCYSTLDGLCLDCPESDTKGAVTDRLCPSCYMTDLRGYLKIKCEEPGSAGEVYRCWSSNSIYSVTNIECDEQYFTNICEDDPRFYQLCGFIPCAHTNEDKHGYCGNFICNDIHGRNINNLTSSLKNVSSVEFRDHHSCDGNLDCLNNADERPYCNIDSENDLFYRCPESKKNLTQDKMCDGISHCERVRGADEVGCNHTFGVECNVTYNGTTGLGWIEPSKICDGNTDCDGGEDETGCGDHIRSCQSEEDEKYFERDLTWNQLCGKVPGLCLDNKDQLNCSESVMECLVNNHTTSLREANVCDDHKTCDNGFDEKCKVAGQNCYIHKHRFCDGHYDCPSDERDEESEGCKNKVANFSCERVVGGMNGSIPQDWLCDGMKDCRDGSDENRTLYTVCGVGKRQRCIPKGQICQEQYQCPESEKTIKLSLLCDNVGSCSGENRVCSTAQGVEPPLVILPVHEGVKRVGHCLPGLDNKTWFGCTTEVLKRVERVSELIVTPLVVKFPIVTEKLKCRYMFGEPYVFASCNGKCVEENATCPTCLLNSSSCLFMRKKILVPSLTTKLTVVETEKGGYSNNIFSCGNGNCISYDKVCDLADDCGNGKDEKGCINHFKCNVSDRKYLRVEAKCNGKIDCANLADECNEDCGKRIIEAAGLRVFAWVVGVLASLINVVAIIKKSREVLTSKTDVIFINSTFIVLIALGDLLIGVYLLIIVIVDQSYSTGYCEIQLQWLASVGCSVMGVVSTIGSQVSLFSMCCLSLYRANYVRSLTGPRRLSHHFIILTSSIAAFILLISTAIAVIPLFNMIENYFINGLYYPESPMFIGATNKEDHLEIIKQHHGRFSGTDVNWEVIRIFVKEMFTTDVNPSGVVGQKVGFYGNAGVCLFKYFVDQDDPQKVFSLSILAINFLCFIIITGSYIFIHCINTSSGAVAGKAQNQRNLALQRKITMIILTDFICWFPFIIMSILHYMEMINATEFYVLCSIVLLPVNSVINPLLYDDELVKLFTKAFDKVTSNVRTSIRVYRDSSKQTSPPFSPGTGSNDQEIVTGTQQTTSSAL